MTRTFLLGVSLMSLAGMTSLLDLALLRGGELCSEQTELLLRPDLATPGSLAVFILWTEERWRGRDFSSSILLHTGQQRWRGPSPGGGLGGAVSDGVGRQEGGWLLEGGRLLVLLTDGCSGGVVDGGRLLVDLTGVGEGGAV